MQGIENLSRWIGPISKSGAKFAFAMNSMRMMQLFRAYVPYLIAAAGALCGPTVLGTPLQYGSSYYELILVPDPFSGSNNSWATANEAALSRSYNGYAGHLATVTSAAENNFLVTLIPSSIGRNVAGAWLGGKAPGGWLTGPEVGEEFTYTRWAGVEPNNHAYAYAYMYIGSYATGFWADDWGDLDHGAPDSRNDPVIGYFVEYEQTSLVPESVSSFAMVLSGLVLTTLWFPNRRLLTRSR